LSSWAFGRLSQGTCPILEPNRRNSSRIFVEINNGEMEVSFSEMRNWRSQRNSGRTEMRIIRSVGKDGAN
jgi:hypothetical protein